MSAESTHRFETARKVLRDRGGVLKTGEALSPGIVPACGYAAARKPGFSFSCPEGAGRRCLSYFRTGLSWDHHADADYELKRTILCLFHMLFQITFTLHLLLADSRAPHTNGALPT